MVQVHVPQGVGVRVPPWAPLYRIQQKSRDREITAFLLPGAFLRAALLSASLPSAWYTAVNARPVSGEGKYFAKTKMKVDGSGGGL